MLKKAVQIGQKEIWEWMILHNSCSPNHPVTWLHHLWEKWTILCTFKPLLFRILLICSHMQHQLIQTSINFSIFASMRSGKNEQICNYCLENETGYRAQVPPQARESEFWWWVWEFTVFQMSRWLSGKESVSQEGNTGSMWSLGWKITRRRKWQPTPIFCLGNPMDRGAC